MQQPGVESTSLAPVKRGAEQVAPGQRATGRRPDTFWGTLGHNPIRPILIGLLLAVLAGALGALASLHGPVFYTSKTVMMIDDPTQLASSGSQNEYVTLDELRYKYAGLVNTDVIAGPVATSLHLPVGSVIGSVSAEVPTLSLLMDVDASASTPQEAQTLAQAVANEVTSYVRAEDVQYQIPPPQQFTFNTVDPASAAIAQRPSTGKALTLAIGLAVLFFVLGLVGTQLVRYLR